MSLSGEIDIVYVLTEYYDHEGRVLLGAYRTREAARQAALRALHDPHGADAYIVDEVRLGTTITRETDWMDRVAKR